MVWELEGTLCRRLKQETLCFSRSSRCGVVGGVLRLGDSGGPEEVVTAVSSSLLPLLRKVPVDSAQDVTACGTPPFKIDRIFPTGMIPVRKEALS